MPLQFRRVVTGHDAEGRAVVLIDETAKNLVSARPGATAGVVWTTEGFPVDNNGSDDEGAAQDRDDARERHRSFASSSSRPARPRATTAPTRSTMPSS